MMELDYVVRELVKKDCLRLFELTCRLLDFYGHCALPRTRIIDLETDAGFDDITKKRFTCYVAQITNQSTLIGYVMFCPKYSVRRGKEYFISDLFVEEKYRGQGVASKLLMRVTEQAALDNCSRIVIYGTDWNRRSICFYDYLKADDLKKDHNINIFVVEKPDTLPKILDDYLHGKKEDSPSEDSDHAKEVSTSKRI